ncbi:MAG: tyrosine-protein phosphatase [Flavisolibacter sp.]
MIFFKKKETPSTDLAWLKTDIHSHLIPGIDDGSPDLSTSLELVRGFAALGYQKIITTPHIMGEVYPNTPDIITAGAEKLQQAISEAGLAIECRAAAEYYMDEGFQKMLRDKVPLLTISDNIVLTEFSMLSAPLDLQEVLFEMQMNNYQPLIAHPERYSYLNRKREVFDELKASGCYLQVNLLSLVGYYGSTVQELAEYLLKKGYYDFAGTDLHHAKHLEALSKLGASPLFKRLRDSGLIKNPLL